MWQHCLIESHSLISLTVNFPPCLNLLVFTLTDTTIPLVEEREELAVLVEDDLSCDFPQSYQKTEGEKKHFIRYNHVPRDDGYTPDCTKSWWHS